MHSQTIRGGCGGVCWAREGENKAGNEQEQELQTTQRTESSKPDTFLPSVAFCFFVWFCWLQIISEMSCLGFAPSSRGIQWLLHPFSRVCKLILHKIFSKA